MMHSSAVERPEHAWATLTLGWALLAQEQLADALAALTSARDALARHGAPLGVLHARHGILLVNLLYKLDAAALTDWAALAAEYTAHGMPLEAARVQAGQVRCLYLLWRSADALQLGATVLPTLAAHGTPTDNALCRRAIAIAHLQNGAYAEAETLLCEVAAMFHQITHPAELAKTQFEQARLAIYREDVHTALEDYARVAAQFQRLGLALRSAFCTKNIGFLAAKCGQTDRAFAVLLAARRTFDTYHLPQHSADCTHNMGVAAFYCGMFELALSLWRQTEAAYIALDRPGMVLSSRHNQAEALFGLGNLEAAEALLNALIPLAQELGSFLELAEILQIRGEINHRQGDLASAHADLQQAAAMFAQQANRPAAARVVAAQGWIALAAADLRTTEACFQQAAADLAALPMFHWRTVYGLGRCAEQRGDLAAALAHYRAACAQVATLRQAIAESHASSSVFREAQQLVQAAIRLAVELPDPALVLHLAEQQRALTLQQQLQHHEWIFPPELRGTYEARRETLRRLATDSSSPAALHDAVQACLEILLLGRHATLPSTETTPMPWDLAGLRSDLSATFGQGWTALIYVPHAENMIALCLTPDTLDLHVIALDRLLRRMLERACLPQARTFTYQDLAFEAGQRDTPWADLSALGERLIPPEVGARIHPAQRLLIVPSGVLHSLPWAALRWQGAWLAEQAIIQLCPSLQRWQELRQRPVLGQQALLVALTDFGERAEALPYALQANDLVAAHYAGTVDRLEQAAATRTALLAAAQSGALHAYKLIHITTHGQLINGQGMLAHLKLADDDLLADEVSQLRLGGALVVLVACDGALGETLPGDEVVSLNWAFLAAGARDVVASLWPLYDAALPHLLPSLYAALAAGADAPTAVATMQRTCLEHTDPLMRNPLFWASLCAVGAGR
jgi:tetratricopeptide (TPR) repeat protein